ncbi:MAG: LysR family transcriptional regulator [Blastocatellia bacterium]|nr:LysR family transcriptional regulator [Blastocatellia bacterium]
MMMEDFNLYPLHVFRLVARSGSATRAARELRISQPAVSAHLRALEQRFGEPLFERTPQGMLLTEIGEIVLEQANRLFALHQDLPALADAARGQVRGEVVVAASSTPGAYCVPDLLRRFQEKHPQARATLLVGDSAEVLTWLREYRAPMGVMGEMSMDAGLHREEIGADELRLVTAAGDSLHRCGEIDSRRLGGRTLFLREAGSSTRAGAEALLGALLPAFERVVEMNSAEAIKQSVISGLGVAVLSSWATQLEEKAGLLRPVRDRRLRQRRRFYAVRRRDRTLTGAAAALWEILAQGPSRRGPGKTSSA